MRFAHFSAISPLQLSRSQTNGTTLDIFSTLHAATMSFETIWYSRPRGYGKGARSWYVGLEMRHGAGDWQRDE